LNVLFTGLSQIQTAWNNVQCSDKCRKACHVKHCMCPLPAIHKRFSLLIGHCALWRYVNSRLLLNQTLFQMVPQTDCWYINHGQMVQQTDCWYINHGQMVQQTDCWYINHGQMVQQTDCWYINHGCGNMLQCKEDDTW